MRVLHTHATPPLYSFLLLVPTIPEHHFSFPQENSVSVSSDPERVPGTDRTILNRCVTRALLNWNHRWHVSQTVSQFEDGVDAMYKFLHEIRSWSRKCLVRVLCIHVWTKKLEEEKLMNLFLSVFLFFYFTCGKIISWKL